MASFGEQRRDSLRRIAYRARAIPGAQFAMRVHTIERVVRVSEAPRSHIAEKVTPITEANGQPPRIRWLSAEELTVGQLNPGTAEVLMTPENSAGGTDIALLRGDDLQPNDKLYFRVTGPHHPNGALYRRFKLNDDRAFHYTMQIVPVEQEEP